MLPTPGHPITSEAANYDEDHLGTRVKVKVRVVDTVLGLGREKGKEKVSPRDLLTSVMTKPLMRSRANLKEKEKARKVRKARKKAKVKMVRILEGKDRQHM